MLDRGAGVAFGMATPEQPGKGAVRGAGASGPVTCSSTMSAASGAWLRAASMQEGQVPSVIQAMTLTVISLR